jgi:hypothetical protein
MIILSFFLSVVNIVYKLLILLFTYHILSSIKVILIAHCLYLSYCLYYIYPIYQRLTLSGLRRWKMRFPLEYKLESTKDHVINIGVLVTYFMIFIVAILWQRFYNSNRVIDLNLYYNKLRYIIIITPVSSLILNVLLLLVIILLFRSLMSIITKYVRHQFIVRHIYLYGYEFYNNLLFNIYMTYMYAILEKLIHHIFHILRLRKYPNNPLAYKSLSHYKFRIYCYEYNTPLEDFLLYKWLEFDSPLYNTIHKKLLIIVIFYDILFNDFILTHMYALLPYVFLYEIWIKIKTFAGERIYGIGDIDTIIHGILYKPGYEAMPGLVVIDGRYYDSSLIGEIVLYYVYNDFRDIHYKWTEDYNQRKKKEVSIMQRTKRLYDRLQKQLNVYEKYWLIIILIFLLVIS